MQFNFFFSLNKLVSGWPYNDAKFTQCVFTLLFLKQNSFNWEIIFWSDNHINKTTKLYQGPHVQKAVYSFLG